MVEVSEAVALAEIASCFDATGKQAAPAASTTKSQPLAAVPNTVKPQQSTPVVAAPAVKKTGKAKLFVSTSPDDAKVRILNIKPVFRQGLELVDGSYHIEVSAKGYHQEKRWIKLAQGESRLLQIDLLPVE